MWLVVDNSEEYLEDKRLRDTIDNYYKHNRTVIILLEKYKDLTEEFINCFDYIFIKSKHLSIVINMNTKENACLYKTEKLPKFTVNMNKYVY
jgi:hypothetical protein